MAALKDLAAEERRAYYRKWRAKNTDKVRKHNENYWKKRVLKMLEAEGDKKAGA